MSAKRMRGMGTGETIAIVGLGLLGVYLLMKSKTATPVIVTTTPVASGSSTTNTLINDGASVINSFINALT